MLFDLTFKVILQLLLQFVFHAPTMNEGTQPVDEIELRAFLERLGTRVSES
jgi:hypothetical protein